MINKAIIVKKIKYANNILLGLSKMKTEPNNTKGHVTIGNKILVLITRNQSGNLLEKS